MRSHIELILQQYAFAFLNSFTRSRRLSTSFGLKKSLFTGCPVRSKYRS
ncbi:hypothetical protein [Rubritalea tangerina]